MDKKDETSESLVIKNVDGVRLKELIDTGLIHEANRLFFHPLGLALSYSVETPDTPDVDSEDSILDEEKTLDSLSLIETDDSDGWVFIKLDWEKIDNFAKWATPKWDRREKNLGFLIQESDYDFDTED